MVTLQRATPGQDALLRELLQSYIQELSEIFPVAREPDGRFKYEKLSLYWAEPTLRHAFVIKCGDEVAGFALATRGSPASDDPDDYDVAEFFVLPAHRRAGVGRQAAAALWNELPGQWVVRVAEANESALRFWRDVIAAFASGRFVERAWPGQPRGWRVFTFASVAPTRMRAGNAEDIEFLEAMLFEAFVWDRARECPTFDALGSDPEFRKLLASWGRRGDRALIAEDGGAKVGAAWFRLWTAEHNSYGFVDATTPEVAMAVRQDHRRKGIGRALLTALIGLAREDGFPALSLSVSPRNPARTLYESLGFTKVGESGTSWTLRLPLGTHDRTA